MALSKKSSLVIEIIFYVLGSLLALWGLTYIVLGLLSDNLGPSNLFIGFNDTIKQLFGLTPFYWGLIILSIGAVVIIFTLCLAAKKNDRQFEREARRQARLAQAKKAENIVDAEVK